MKICIECDDEYKPKYEGATCIFCKQRYHEYCGYECHSGHTGNYYSICEACWSKEIQK